MTVREVFICDGVRTPIGKYGGAFGSMRADDLAAVPLRVLFERNPNLVIDDVWLGCANQAGEDNRNVARMALLLAGLPVTVPGVTVNRLCASGMSAVAAAANAIATGEMEVVIAGGIEHMTRAPYVMAKPDAPFARTPEIFDSTLGWRFVNERFKSLYGIDSMGETAENVAEKFSVTREDQDRFAERSQAKTQRALAEGRFVRELIPVEIPQRKGAPIVVSADEYPRSDTTLDALARLTPAFRKGGTVTAGNASGINDGACAVLLASQFAIERFHLKPRARFVGSAVSGVEPRMMGIGPVPATRSLLSRVGRRLDELSVIELNEAFAAQSLACIRELGLADDDPRINPNGGAIALGHPLGMSGARLVLTAMCELEVRKARSALCTMCIGVGQGMACLLDRVE